MVQTGEPSGEESQSVTEPVDWNDGYRVSHTPRIQPAGAELEETTVRKPAPADVAKVAAKASYWGAGAGWD